MQDMMLEAGWPAHLVEHAKAIAHVRTFADMEPGWYEGDAGGPAPQEAIDDAIDVIVQGALRFKLPAPWPFPRPDALCGVELDWAGASEELCCLEWAGPGMWDVYVERVTGVPRRDTHRAMYAIWRQLFPAPPPRPLTAKDVADCIGRWEGLLNMLDD